MNNKIEILKTKLFRPRLPLDFVPRPQLVELLEKHHGKPLSLISAPAGYGKSTTLSSWLEHCNHRTAWYSIDESDNNLIVFTNYFIEGIRKSLENFGKEILSVINARESPNINTISGLLLNELTQLNEDLIFVLDDYHNIKNREIHIFVELLLKHPVRGFHLVLSTRIDPPIPLAKFRAASQLTEVRARNLKFNENETQTFSAFFDLSFNKNITNLVEEIEGWPAGLRLAFLSLMNKEPSSEFWDKMPHNNQYIVEYLLSEMLFTLNDEEREILFIASSLDRFSESLLTEILSSEKENMENCFQFLLERNLFLIPLDENRKWFRFHHLFRSILEKESSKVLSKKKIEIILHNAAKWFISNGLLEEGLKYFIQIGKVEEAIDVFNAHREDLMSKSQFLRISNILKLFTNEQIDKSIVLLLTKAWDMIYNGKTLEMFEKLDDIEALLKVDKKNSSDKNFYGELCTLYSWKTYNLHSDFEATLKYTEDAFKSLHPKNNYPLGYAWIFHAGALQCLNRTNEALNKIHKQIDLDDENLLNYYLFMILNYIHLLEADFNNLYIRASQYLEKAISSNDKENIVHAKYFLGMYYYEINDISKAQKILEEAYENRHYVVGIHQFGIISALATICVITGDSNSIKRIIKIFSDSAIAKGNPYFILLRMALDADIKFRLGDIAEAKKWGVNSGEIPLFPMTHFFVPQIPKIKIFIYSESEELQQEAKNLLGEVNTFLLKTNNKLFLAKILALKSLLQYDSGKTKKALISLEESLTIAEPANLIRTYVDLGPKMSKLLKQFATEKKQVKYVGKILKAFSSNSINKPNIHKKNQLDINSENGWKNHISPREYDILKLLSKKLKNKEIAEQLFISPSTVKRHTINIYHKLNVNSREEAAQKAKELGIIS